MCTHCGRFQMGELIYYFHDSKKYIFFHNIYDDNGKRIATSDMDSFKERLLIEEDAVSFSLDRESKSLIRVKEKICVADSHQLKDLEGIVNVMNVLGEIIEVKIPIAKCIACNKYYIHDREYKKLKTLGMIMCRIEDKKNQYDIWGRSFSEWNQESILHTYGYNVSSTTNLSEAQRHTILKMLVTYKLLTKFSVIDHLEFLINLNKGKAGFAVAVKKWKADVDFLNMLSVDVSDEKIEAIKVVKHLNWMHK